MGACPFCGGEVGEDLLLNGGHCPHCLIEIPGEETPTDPGEAAQAQQAAEEAAVQRGRSGRMVAAAVVGVLVVGVGGWALFGQAEPEPMQIDMGEFDYASVDEHKDLELPPDEQDDEDAGKQPPKSPQPRTPSNGPAAPPPSNAVASADPPPTGGQLGRAPELADPLEGDMFFGSGPAAKGVQAIELCKDGEIYEAVRGIMRVKAPHVRRCYERALNNNEGLRGQWMASFVINKDGSTSKVKVEGQGVADAVLEPCLTNQIDGWTFPPLCEAKPISTPFTFNR